MKPGMKTLLRRYRFAALTLLVLGGLFLVDVALARQAVSVTAFSLREMLLVVPPIFILLGLLDVWVPREIMVRFMGEKSGAKGIVLAFTCGAAAAGPLYGAFPVAAVLLKKGVSIRNIFILIGAWSTTKIPMLLFEMEYLGPRFALTRLLLNIPGIIIIAWILNRSLSPAHREDLLHRAGELAGK